MIVLKMNADKSLIVTKRGNTYENENLAEKIKIILPKFINGNDLKDCNVFFCYVNKINLGNVADISMLVSDYNDDSYICEADIDKVFTYKTGMLDIWIKALKPNIEDEEKSLVALSDVVKYEIFPHIDVDETISDTTFSLLDQITMKYITLRDEIEGIEDKATYAYVDEKVAEIYKAMKNLDPSPGGGGSDIDNEVILSIIKRIDGLEKSIEGLKIPAKTSDLTNDSGFQTSKQVETTVSTLLGNKNYATKPEMQAAVAGVQTSVEKAGYQNAKQVDDAIIAKGYQTEAQVNEAISNTTKDLPTKPQVELIITSKGYQTATDVNEVVESKGYQTSKQVEDAITNATKGFVNEEYVNSKVSSVYRYKGSCVMADLPKSGQEVGDTYNLIDDTVYGVAGTNVAWTPDGWDALSGVFDTSKFLTDDEAKDFAKKSTTLEGYGITNGVNNTQLYLAKTEVLNSAKAYTDEIFGNLINAAEVGM